MGVGDDWGADGSASPSPTPPPADFQGIRIRCAAGDAERRRGQPTSKEWQRSGKAKPHQAPYNLPKLAKYWAPAPTVDWVGPGTGYTVRGGICWAPVITDGAAWWARALAVGHEDTATSASERDGSGADPAPAPAAAEGDAEGDCMRGGAPWLEGGEDLDDDTMATTATPTPAAWNLKPSANVIATAGALPIRTLVPFAKAYSNLTPEALAKDVQELPKVAAPSEGWVYYSVRENLPVGYDEDRVSRSGFGLWYRVPRDAADPYELWHPGRYAAAAAILGIAAPPPTLPYLPSYTWVPYKPGEVGVPFPTERTVSKGVYKEKNGVVWQSYRSDTVPPGEIAFEGVRGAPTGAQGAAGSGSHSPTPPARAQQISNSSNASASGSDDGSAGRAGSPGPEGVVERPWTITAKDAAARTAVEGDDANSHRCLPLFHPRLQVKPRAGNADGNAPATTTRDPWATASANERPRFPHSLPKMRVPGAYWLPFLVYEHIPAGAVYCAVAAVEGAGPGDDTAASAARGERSYLETRRGAAGNNGGSSANSSFNNDRSFGSTASGGGGGLKVYWVVMTEREAKAYQYGTAHPAESRSFAAMASVTKLPSGLPQLRVQADEGEGQADGTTECAWVYYRRATELPPVLRTWTPPESLLPSDLPSPAHVASPLASPTTLPAPQQRAGGYGAAAAAAATTTGNASSSGNGAAARALTASRDGAKSFTRPRPQGAGVINAASRSKSMTNMAQQRQGAASKPAPASTSTSATSTYRGGYKPSLFSFDPSLTMGGGSGSAAGTPESAPSPAPGAAGMPSPDAAAQDDANEDDTMSDLWDNTVKSLDAVFVGSPQLDASVKSVSGFGASMSLSTNPVAAAALAALELAPPVILQSRQGYWAGVRKADVEPGETVFRCPPPPKNVEPPATAGTGSGRSLRRLAGGSGTGGGPGTAADPTLKVWRGLRAQKAVQQPSAPAAATLNGVAVHPAVAAITAAPCSVHKINKDSVWVPWHVSEAITGQHTSFPVLGGHVFRRGDINWVVYLLQNVPAGRVGFLGRSQSHAEILGIASSLTAQLPHPPPAIYTQMQKDSVWVPFPSAGHVPPEVDVLYSYDMNVAAVVEDPDAHTSGRSTPASTTATGDRSTSTPSPDAVAPQHHGVAAPGSDAPPDPPEPRPIGGWRGGDAERARRSTGAPPSSSGSSTNVVTAEGASVASSAATPALEIPVSGAAARAATRQHAATHTTPAGLRRHNTAHGGGMGRGGARGSTGATSASRSATALSRGGVGAKSYGSLTAAREGTGAGRSSVGAGPRGANATSRQRGVTPPPKAASAPVSPPVVRRVGVARAGDAAAPAAAPTVHAAPTPSGAASTHGSPARATQSAAGASVRSIRRASVESSQFSPRSSGDGGGGMLSPTSRAARGGFQSVAQQPPDAADSRRSSSDVNLFIPSPTEVLEPPAGPPVYWRLLKHGFGEGYIPQRKSFASVLKITSLPYGLPQATKGSHWVPYPSKEQITEGYQDCPVFYLNGVYYVLCDDVPVPEEGFAAVRLPPLPKSLADKWPYPGEVEALTRRNLDNPLLMKLVARAKRQGVEKALVLRACQQAAAIRDPEQRAELMQLIDAPARPGQMVSWLRAFMDHEKSQWLERKTEAERALRRFQEMNANPPLNEADDAVGNGDSAGGSGGASPASMVSVNDMPLPARLPRICADYEALQTLLLRQQGDPMIDKLDGGRGVRIPSLPLLGAITTQKSLKEHLSVVVGLPKTHPRKRIFLLFVLIEAVFLVHHFRLTNEQLLGILCMTDRASFGTGGGIGQMKTGEGKTITIALAAAYYILITRDPRTGRKGLTVDVMTSSETLAARDALKAKPLYNLLGISVGHNCREQGEGGVAAPPPDLTKVYCLDVVYGTTAEFQFTFIRDVYLNHNERGGRTYDIAIVDEVDNMLIDSSGRSARLSASIPGMDQLHWVYYLVLKKMAEWGEGLDPARLEATLKSHHAIQTLTPVGLRHLVLDNLGVWIRSAVKSKSLASDREYVISEKKVINVDHVNTGSIQYGTVLSNGMHQFLQVREGVSVTDETAIGGFSSVLAFFQLYQWKTGLTGTIGEAEEQKEFDACYQLQFFYVPPHHESTRENKVDVVTSEAAWLKTIARAVHEQSVVKKRPTLIIAEAIKTCEQIRSHLVATHPEMSVQSYTGVQDAHQDDILKAGGSSGMVTCSTNLAGRGMDIVTNDVSEANGGLYVVCSFLPSNQRVEMQAAGRTCRQGKLGTFHLIVNTDNPAARYTVDVLKYRRKAGNVRKSEHKLKVVIPVGQHTAALFCDFCQLKDDVFANNPRPLPFEGKYEKRAWRERWMKFMGQYHKEFDRVRDEAEAAAFLARQSERYADFRAGLMRDLEQRCVVKNPVQYARRASDWIGHGRWVAARKDLEKAAALPDGDHPILPLLSAVVKANTMSGVAGAREVLKDLGRSHELYATWAASLELLQSLFPKATRTVVIQEVVAKQIDAVRAAMDDLHAWLRHDDGVPLSSLLRIVPNDGRTYTSQKAPEDGGNNQVRWKRLGVTGRLVSWFHEAKKDAIRQALYDAKNIQKPPPVVADIGVDWDVEE